MRGGAELALARGMYFTARARTLRIPLLRAALAAAGSAAAEPPAQDLSNYWTAVALLEEATAKELRR